MLMTSDAGSESGAASVKEPLASVVVPVVVPDQYTLAPGSASEVPFSFFPFTVPLICAEAERKKSNKMSVEVSCFILIWIKSIACHVMQTGIIPWLLKDQIR